MGFTRSETQKLFDDISESWAFVQTKFGEYPCGTRVEIVSKHDVNIEGFVLGYGKIGGHKGSVIYYGVCDTSTDAGDYICVPILEAGIRERIKAVGLLPLLATAVRKEAKDLAEQAAKAREALSNFLTGAAPSEDLD